nr:MAG TPA: hypothetical protein [Caudoviricetes sp.]
MDLKKCLDNLQDECNCLYGEFGVTPNVIGLQLSINRLRNEFDCVDESELLYEDFVQ